RAFIDAGTASGAGPQRILADSGARYAQIVAIFPGRVRVVMRADGQQSLKIRNAAANIQDHLLGIERRSGHIRGANRLTAPAFGTGVSVEQLERAEIGQLGDAELL